MRWRCPTLALLLQLLLGCGLRRAAALALPGDASQAVVLTMTRRARPRLHARRQKTKTDVAADRRTHHSCSALAHWHYVCLWHTRQAHPNSPMYLGAFFYRDSEYTWRPTPHELAFLAALDVTVVRIEEDTTPELARLHATFRHASGNGLVYERFCTARFLGVQHVMDAHGLSSALTFDSAHAPSAPPRFCVQLSLVNPSLTDALSPPLAPLPLSPAQWTLRCSETRSRRSRRWPRWSTCGRLAAGSQCTRAN